MTEEEIAKIMDTPFYLLILQCQDPEGLRLNLSRAIQEGISIGQNQMNLNYNHMLFKGYTEVSIKN